MARRRGHGEGSIYREKTGRWVAELNFGTDAGGKRLRKRFKGRTRGEVQDKLRKAQREISEGRKPGNARDTVAALLRDFLAKGLPASAKSDQTRESYRWAVEDHIIPALGGRKLAELSPDDVDGFLTSKVDEAFSRATLVHFHGVLTRALRWGEHRGRVARNVSQLCDTPHAKKDRRVSKALTVSQAKELITKAAGDRLEALVILGLMVPSRPGELAGLTWPCVDFERGLIHFRYALHRRQGGALELGELKTEQSRRSVEVPEMVMAALRRRKVAQAKERMRSYVWANPGDLVFTTTAGGPIDPANLRRTLRRLTTKAKIDGTWTIYELRHSAVSILSASGVRIEDIADAAGHKNARVTEVVYRHNLSETISSAKGPMEATFGEISEP